MHISRERKEKRKTKEKTKKPLWVCCNFLNITNSWGGGISFAHTHFFLPFLCCKKPHSIQPFVLFRLQLVALFCCGEFIFFHLETKKPNPPPLPKKKVPFLKRIFFLEKYIKNKKGPKSPGF
jgi:hypothetical protein